MSTAAVKAEMGTVVEVLHAHDPQEFRRWDELACTAPATDAYYRPGYVSAYEPLENSRAVALRLNIKQTEFLLPLLIRPILDKSGARHATDALTPYGYGGLLPLGTRPPNSEAMLEVIATLREWCALHKLVACLIRLHPLLYYAELLRQPLHDNAGAWLSAPSPTTAIDLQNWQGERSLLRGMSENRRRNLAKASQMLRTTWHAGADASALDTFRELYGAKMQELGAREFFFFPREYYTRMSQGLGENFVTVIAWAGERPVGAAIFLRGPRWAHYHLGATNQMGRELSASTLLIHEGARWAAQARCQLLHLGGGMQKDDSLMKFKSSFGGPRFFYASLTVLGDPDGYDQLCRDKAAWPYGAVEPPRAVMAGIPAKVLKRV
jgi:hypothetical protein